MCDCHQCFCFVLFCLIPTLTIIKVVTEFEKLKFEYVTHDDRLRFSLKMEAIRPVRGVGEYSIFEETLLCNTVGGCN